MDLSISNECKQIGAGARLLMWKRISVQQLLTMGLKWVSTAVQLFTPTQCSVCLGTKILPKIAQDISFMNYLCSSFTILIATVEAKLNRFFIMIAFCNPQNLQLCIKIAYTKFLLRISTNFKGRGTSPFETPPSVLVGKDTLLTPPAVHIGHSTTFLSPFGA